MRMKLSESKEYLYIFWEDRTIRGNFTYEELVELQERIPKFLKRMKKIGKKKKHTYRH